MLLIKSTKQVLNNSSYCSDHTIRLVFFSFLPYSKGQFFRFWIIFCWYDRFCWLDTKSHCTGSNSLDRCFIRVIPSGSPLFRENSNRRLVKESRVYNGMWHGWIFENVENLHFFLNSGFGRGLALKCLENGMPVFAGCLTQQVVFFIFV